MHGAYLQDRFILWNCLHTTDCRFVMTRDEMWGASADAVKELKLKKFTFLFYSLCLMCDFLCALVGIVTGC
jgi:hypothetical protein